MDTRPFPFLDVSTLLSRSQPRGRSAWIWYALSAVFLLMLLLSYAETDSSGIQAFFQILSSLLMIGVLTMSGVLTWTGLRRFRREQQSLHQIEELMQLRRWPEAAMLLQTILSEPAKAPATRVQGLIFLSGLLARYQRFSDAIFVGDYLLEHFHLDPETTLGLKVGRAMSMLREDHLLDADRAIAELRRYCTPHDCGPVALVELYRDVKTGHADEAVQLFDTRLPAIRAHLGHRLGDAYALVARAYDLLGEDASARRSWESATILMPAIELTRRYPEVQSLAEKYPPAAIPIGAA